MTADRAQHPAAAVVLYGPPASGKDTITAALTELVPEIAHFHPLKVGSGRTDGYRMTTVETLASLRASGELVWETRRYGATYAVDRAELVRLLVGRAVPVLHLAEPEAPARLAAAFPSARWCLVQLVCDRDIAVDRIRRRSTGDTAARVAAYDQFQPLDVVDLSIDTGTTPPPEAAELVAKVLHRP